MTSVTEVESVQAAPAPWVLILRMDDAVVYTVFTETSPGAGTNP